MQVTCSKNNPTFFLCSKKSCKNDPSMCLQMTCECQQRHTKCKLMTKCSTVMKDIEAKIDVARINLKAYNARISALFGEIDSLVEEAKRNHQYWIDSFGLLKQQKLFFDSYKRGNIAHLSGNLISELLEQSQTEIEIFYSDQEKLLRNMTSVKENIKKLLVKLEGAYQDVHLEKKQEKSEDIEEEYKDESEEDNLKSADSKSKLNVHQPSTYHQSLKIHKIYQTTLLQTYKSRINSKIEAKRYHALRKQYIELVNSIKRVRPSKHLTIKLENLNKLKKQIQELTQTDYYDRLLKLFPATITKLQLQLLYRASEHQFSATKYHQLCDGKNPTLVLILTQFDKVMGGYLPLTLNRDIVSSSESFVFLLESGQMINIIPNNQTSGDSDIYSGPKFSGHKFELHIRDSANILSSKCLIGKVYNYKNFKYETQQSQIRWSGQTEGNQFLVKEWQVYKVELH